MRSTRKTINTLIFLSMSACAQADTVADHDDYTPDIMVGDIKGIEPTGLSLLTSLAAMGIPSAQVTSLNTEGDCHLGEGGDLLCNVRYTTNEKVVISFTNLHAVPLHPLK